MLIRFGIVTTALKISKMKASECKCCKCGKQAVAFFPIIDPDIPSYPYCKDCLHDAKIELAVALFKDDEEKMTIARNVIEYQENNNND